MSNLLEKASIITTPTAYSDGKLHSVKPKEVLGSELVTNGSFATDSDWNKASNWTISGGTANADGSSGGQLSQVTGGVVIGRTYRLEYTILNYVSGSFRFSYGGTSESFNTSNGTYTTYRVATSTNSTILSSSINFIGSIDNVSVKEVTDADFDFQRGSAATRVNSQGIIENVQTLSGNLVQNGDFSEIGSELVTNGDFATDTNWVKQAGWSINNGTANCDGTSGSLYQSSVVEIGKSYLCEFEVTSIISGSVAINAGGNTTGTPRTSVGTYSEILYVVGGSNDRAYIISQSFQGSIDNVSFKEVGQNWSLGSSNVSIQEGKAVYINQSAGNNGIYQNVLSQNKKYKVSFDVSNYQSGDITAWAGGSQNSLSNDVVSGNGLKTIKIENSGSTNGFLVFGNNSTGNYSLDNISVIEITDDTDLPRIDYTDGCGSLLLEPQSTNLMTYSSDFSLYVLSSINLVSNIILSPDNSLTASKIYPTLSGNYRHIKWNPQSPASGLNTFSIFAKAGELEHLVLIDYDGSGAGVDYNLSTGVATDNSTNPFDSVEMIDYGNGWYRCIATTTNAYFYYILSDNGGLSVTANGTDGLYIWGAQVEAQSYATSYIPTSGSTVTRLADVCDNSGSSDLINSTEGVLYAEVAALANDGTNRVIQLSDGTNSNRVFIGYWALSNEVRMLVQVGGVTQAFDGNTSYDILNFNKIAFKYKENDFALWINGTKVITDTSGITFPIGTLTQLDFDSNGIAIFYGKTKSVAVFKEALTNDELEGLTGEGYDTFNALALANNYTII